MKKFGFVFVILILSGCSFSQVGSFVGGDKTVSSEQYARDLDPEKKIELIKKQRKEQNTIRK